VKQLGVGFSTYNEMCGSPVPHPRRDPLRRRRLGQATIRFRRPARAGRHGHVAARPGHETAWSQIVADQLGVRRREVEVLHGDTRVSRSAWTRTAAAAFRSAAWRLDAADKIVDKAREIVAHQLEVSADDLEYADGRSPSRARRQGR
jgi:carbon-monoxide dehydrogenase large subunit